MQNMAFKKPNGRTHGGKSEPKVGDSSSSETDDYQLRRMQSPDELKKHIMRIIPDSDQVELNTSVPM